MGDFQNICKNKTINKIHRDICCFRSISIGDEASSRFAAEDSLDEDSIEEQEAPSDYVKGEEDMFSHNSDSRITNQPLSGR